MDKEQKSKVRPIFKKRTSSEEGGGISEEVGRSSQSINEHEEVNLAKREQ